MELLLHQWGDWPELYRNTDKTEATEIVIIDSQMNYRGKLDTYELEFFYCVNAHIYVTIIFDLNITHPEQQRDWPKEAAATIPMEPVLIPTAQAGR